MVLSYSSMEPKKRRPNVRGALFSSFMTSYPCFAVVGLLLSEDGAYIQKETLVDFVKACDGVGPRVDLSTLFTGEVGCVCACVGMFNRT